MEQGTPSSDAPKEFQQQEAPAAQGEASFTGATEETGMSVTARSALDAQPEQFLPPGEASEPSPGEPTSEAPVAEPVAAVPETHVAPTSARQRELLAMAERMRTDGREPVDYLSESERRFLPHLLDGKRIVDIADREGVVPSTVSVSLSNLLRSLATNPETKDYIEPDRALELGINTGYALPIAYAPTTETPSATDAATDGEALRPRARMEHNQASKILGELATHDVDIADRMPDEKGVALAAVRLLAQGMKNGEVATALSLSPRHVNMIGRRAVNAARAELEAGRLPEGITADLFEPAGEVPSVANDGTLGGWIRGLVEESGMTVQEIARRAGTTTAEMSRIMNERAHPLRTVRRVMDTMHPGRGEALYNEYMQSVIRAFRGNGE